MESSAVNIYLPAPFAPPSLGKLLGDGRGPAVTAAFLLLAMTVAQ